MAKSHPLTAEPRTLTGRKVKQLRKQDLLPANVFGKHVESLAIQLPLKEFLKVYEQTGDTGLIDLTIAGDKASRPVLVSNTASDPVSSHLLHVDFRQVNLKEKLSAEIPVVLVGENPDVEKEGNSIVQILDHITAEALPTDFPEKLELDVSSLHAVGDTLYVKDLPVDSSKLTVETDSEEIIAKVEAPAAEVVEEVPPVTEVGEGEAPAEGETPAEGTPAPESSDKSE